MLKFWVGKSLVKEIRQLLPTIHVPGANNPINHRVGCNLLFWSLMVTINIWTLLTECSVCLSSQKKIRDKWQSAAEPAPRVGWLNVSLILR
jgi:hypothetical protein